MVDMHTAMLATGGLETGAPQEPVLDVDEIQGNILPGFMKPNMAVIGLSFTTLTQKDVAVASDWLAQLVPRVTTLAQVMPSRLAVRSERLQRRVSAGFTEAAAGLDDAWLNVSLSHRAIGILLSATGGSGDADRFTDEAFKVGLAGRSSLLGDPTDPAAEGNPANWQFGGPGREADILLVVGTDLGPTMDQYVGYLVRSAEAAGLAIVYQELGGKLDAVGHEHFGFQDGISQPGVRGLLADGNTYLTPRTVSPAAKPETWLYGLPGQYLVWPGMFVLGYPTQGADPLIPGPATLPGPAWSKNGSYAVYRRLRQDVAAFRAYAEEQAEALGRQGLLITAAELQAKVVGRWPSGAPLARTPHADIPDLGADPLANNHFDFAADTPTLPLAGGSAPSDFPPAKADPVGLTCPLASHIRKVNTRDVGSDQGGRRSSFQRRILRRALPFGLPFPDNGPDPENGNRGLMFLSYQASIVDQFEFLNTAWMNDPVAPRSPGGHDQLIGQNGQPGQDRVRTATIFQPPNVGTVTATTDVVIPTGGGYYFTPSISALRDVLTKALDNGAE